MNSKAPTTLTRTHASKAHAVWKPPRRYPPKGTREINVASTFSPLEWMVDIMPMNETDRKSNDEHINVLTLFNPVSKALFGVPMKSKMTKEVVPKLDKMLEPLVNRSAVKTLITDKGMEFKSVMYKRLLENYNLEGVKPKKTLLYPIERVHRTIQEKINQARDGNLRWVDHLDRVIIEYNSTVHSSIGTDPHSIGLKDMVDLHQQALVDYASMGGQNIEVVNDGIVPNFEVGDVVRKINKSIFRDGYWSNDVYKVVAILPYLRVSIRVIDEDGNPVGRKYPISVFKLTHS